MSGKASSCIQIGFWFRSRPLSRPAILSAGNKMTVIVPNKAYGRLSDGIYSIIEAIMPTYL